MRTHKSIAALMKQVEAQQKHIATAIKTSSKAKVASKVINQLHCAITRSSLIFTLFLNLLKTIFRL